LIALYIIYQIPECMTRNNLIGYSMLLFAQQWNDWINISYSCWSYLHMYVNSVNKLSHII